MSGKKVPTSQSKPQSNSMLTYFTKATPPTSASKSSTPPTTSNGMKTVSTPLRIGIGANSSAVAANFFGNEVVEPIGTPSKLVASATSALTPTRNVNVSTPPKTSSFTPNSSAQKAVTPSSFEFSSSGRKRKTISYKEDDDDDDGDDERKNAPISSSKKKVKREDDDDYNGAAHGSDDGPSDDGDDYGEVDEDDEDVPIKSLNTKSRTPSAGRSSSSAKKAPASSRSSKATPAAVGSDDDMDMIDFGGGDDTGGGSSGAGGIKKKEYSTDFLLPQNRRDAKGIRPGEFAIIIHHPSTVTIIMMPHTVLMSDAAESKRWVPDQFVSFMFV